MDESGEQEIVEAPADAAYRVNWFHTDRPTAGTTFHRQSPPTSGAAGGTDDAASA